MRKFKKLLATVGVILCMSMVLGMGSVFAADGGNTPESRNKYFSEFITNFFDNSEKCSVVDKQGNDITQLFIDLHTNNLKNSQFEIINEFVSQNISKISFVNTEKASECNNEITPYAYVNESVSEQFMEVIEAERNGILAGRSEEIYYTISGNFVYDFSNAKIISCGSALLNIVHTTFGQWWSYDLSNIRTNSKISSDKYTVDFSAGFNIKATLVLPIGDLPLGVPYDFGYISNSVTAYAP